MTSVFLFSISPAIQLLPFVYTDVNNAWEDMKFSWFMQCMEEFGDVASLPMDGLDELTEQCDIEHGYVFRFWIRPRFSLRPISVAENIIMVCVIMNVWKPYIEAFTMLILLPNYRQAFFASIQRMLGMPSVAFTTVAVAPPVSSHWAAKVADAPRSSQRL